MHRTDAEAATAGNLFTNGDPGNGIAATVVEEDWLNAVQEELCNTVEDAGITLVKGTNTQLLAALKNYFSNPVGTVLALDKDLSGTPALPGNYAELNGQLISDGNSPYNGKRIRNLNGAAVSSVPISSLDNGAKTITVSTNDVAAFAVGDTLTFTGASVSNAVVKAVNYSSGVITIGDTTLWGSGSFGLTTGTLTGATAVSSVGAKRYLGGSSSSNGNDVNQSQGNIHYSGTGVVSNTIHVYGNDSSETPGSASDKVGADPGAPSRQSKTSGPRDDGTNGTPRISPSNKPNTQDVVWVLRIK